MDLEIWQDSIEVAGKLFDLTDRLEAKRLYRFAEQLRGSGLSMSNNIVLVLEGRGLAEEGEVTNVLERLDHSSRKITNFQRTLRA